MKYTTKVKQAQKVGNVVIDPKGGELTEDQIKLIMADPYGKDLVKKRFLVIEGSGEKK